MGSDAYIFVHYHHILSNLCILIDYTIPSRMDNENIIRQLDILVFHKKARTVSHYEYNYLIFVFLPIPIGTFPRASRDAISGSVW